ncbi:MAG TPA: IS4 family transposase, partial [Candidatus Competibacteraceae bacterium]|nr:IS4 family transposase [Candidatus Competibacteraceae bacterium]
MLKPTLNPVDTQFEDLLQDLPVDLAASAREFQAFTRARKIKTPQQLLRLVLLYCGLDQALRTVAGNLTLLAERITDSSVRARLQACEPWVKALLSQLLPPLPALPAGSRLSVIDGSSIAAPGADGTNYRLHLRLELVSLSFQELLVTDAHTAESLRHFTLGAGDIALVDRGYCQPAALVETHQQGADWIVRWNSGMPLWTPTGEAFDMARTLRAVPLTQTIVTHAVQVGPAGSAERVVASLHACRLPEAQATAARRRCRRRAQKKGKTLKATTLYLAGWVIVVTTLAPAVWTAETILALYRVRWQVELAIKRWKSLLKVGQLRARAEETLASLWLHGKLLYALLL